VYHLHPAEIYHISCFFASELISKVLAFFINFTFDRAVEPFYGITFGFFAKKAKKIKF
jgi:hypothetical protein